ncbi:hypothetical protein BCV70DRAFT_45379 [Testicularia cyperi]|uniref:Uncharacterized protein n=1 Tax=Testicularia cyperi TaxID=1882483 RepID=A0A317XJX4_9BASI|nr:hypothetical protein BCV70DRAFT_45379 [Testicularia cyperi]
MHPACSAITLGRPAVQFEFSLFILLLFFPPIFRYHLTATGLDLTTVLCLLCRVICTATAEGHELARRQRDTNNNNNNNK